MVGDLARIENRSRLYGRFQLPILPAGLKTGRFGASVAESLIYAGSMGSRFTASIDQRVTSE